MLLLAIVTLPILVMAALVRMARRLCNRIPSASETNSVLSRRQFLGIAVATAPPLFNISLATVALR
jgi:hypothetical protein